jgi:hypothetical protein
MDVPAISNNLNLSNGDLDPSDTPPTMSIDKLFPALLECFGIILCGYIAGRANIITSTQAKGLGNFVSKFALPALLFKNMVLLDFGNVIWPFLWSILIAKVSVFFIVCVITLLVASPDTRFSKAGLFSIFATQSNDFALGYPIGESFHPFSFSPFKIDSLLAEPQNKGNMSLSHTLKSCWFVTKSLIHSALLPKRELPELYLSSQLRPCTRTHTQSIYSTFTW